MITFEKLKSILNQNYSLNINQDSVSFRNLHIDSEKPDVLKFAVYSIKTSNYLYMIEMDFDGKIVNVSNSQRDEVRREYLTKIAHIIGLIINLNSIEKTYERIIYSNSDSSHSQILGHVDKTGKVFLFNKNNVKDIEFPITREAGDKIERYGSPEYIDLFKNFVKKYESCLESFNTYHDHISTYRCHFDIKGLKVELSLEKFFNYKITIRIFLEKNQAIILKGEEVNDVYQIINDLFNCKISNLNRVKMVTLGGGIKYRTVISESPEEIKVKVKFDGEKGRPTAPYDFSFNFLTKTVQVEGKIRSKHIPIALQKFQKKFNEVLVLELKEIKLSNNKELIQQTLKAIRL